MNIPITPGVYAWTCTANGKQYVGSSKNIRWRYYRHTRELRLGIHSNRKLQNAWNKHGAESFRFDVLELVADPATLVEREQHYLDTLQPAYNIFQRAYSPNGYKHTPEALERLRSTHNTPEAVANWVAKVSGKPKSAEHRAKLSAANKGKHVWTQEMRDAHSRAVTGYKHTDEAREKMSVARRGRKHSPEAIEKMRQAKIGSHPTSEAREKIRQGQLARYRREREQSDRA